MSSLVFMSCRKASYSDLETPGKELAGALHGWARILRAAALPVKLGQMPDQGNVTVGRHPPLETDLQMGDGFALLHEPGQPEVRQGAIGLLLHPFAAKGRGLGGLPLACQFCHAFFKPALDVALMKIRL